MMRYSYYMDAAIGAAQTGECEMNAMTKLAAKLTTKELMVQARKMAESTEDYATDVLNVLLTVLDGRIPESEYVAFCDSL